MTGYFWQGYKVRLRPTQPSDWEDWRRESSDSDGIRLMEWGIQLPVDDFNVREMSEKYDHFKDDYRKMFAIETLSNQLAGLINLNTIDYKNGTFSFGLGTNRAHRNQGYASEAVRIILRYGFHELRLQKCNSSCVDINEPSIKLHRKLGFREEGLRRRVIYMNGRYYDNLLFGITKEEFEENDRIYIANQEA